MHDGPPQFLSHMGDTLGAGLNALTKAFEHLKIHLHYDWSDVHKALEHDDIQTASTLIRAFSSKSSTSLAKEAALICMVQKSAHALFFQTLEDKATREWMHIVGHNLLTAAVMRYHATQIESDYQFIITLLTRYRGFLHAINKYNNRVLATIIQLGNDRLFTLFLKLPQVRCALFWGQNQALRTALLFGRETMALKILSFSNVQHSLEDHKFIILKDAAIGGSTLLMQALMQIEVLRDAIHQPPLPTGYKPITCAAMANKLEMVKYLTCLPEVKNEMFEGDFAVLNLCAKSGATDVLHFLLQFPEAMQRLKTWPLSFRHPLIQAAYSAQLMTARYLLQYDFVHNLVKGNPWVIECAFASKNTEMVHLLYRYGADLSGVKDFFINQWDISTRNPKHLQTLKELHEHRTRAYPIVRAYQYERHQEALAASYPKNQARENQLSYARGILLHAQFPRDVFFHVLTYLPLMNTQMLNRLETFAKEYPTINNKTSSRMENF